MLLDAEHEKTYDAVEIVIMTAITTKNTAKNAVYMNNK